MQTAYKMKILIPKNHRVELSLPDSVPAGPAEVIILSSPETDEEGLRGGLGMDVGKGWVADDFDARLPEELQKLFEGEG